MTSKKAIRLILSAVCAFAVSSVWYSHVLFGRQFIALSGVAAGAQPAWFKLAAELSRNLLLASVISWLLDRDKSIGFKAALGLAVILWLGFPFTLLLGSILWQNVSLELGLIHGGDWLLKVLLITLTLWLIDANPEMQSHRTEVRAAQRG